MSLHPDPEPQELEFAWELATLFPVQGAWSETDYFELTDGSNRRIELSDGRLEFIEMPTEVHESLVQFLFFSLYQFVEARRLGKVYSNGIRLRISANAIRLPDVIFLHKKNYQARHNSAWNRADLVMEVVSDAPQDRYRDYEVKLKDYAAGGVSEYWIVDYHRRAVVVHQLVGDDYQQLGEYTGEQHAQSALLEGFTVDIAALFATADDVPR